MDRPVHLDLICQPVRVPLAGSETRLEGGTKALSHATAPPPSVLRWFPSSVSGFFEGEPEEQVVIHCPRRSPQARARRDLHSCPMTSIRLFWRCPCAHSPTPRSPGRGRSGPSTRT